MDLIMDYPKVRGGFCMETRPKPCGLVIFGASGDLTHRKLIPALFNLFKRNLMPYEFFILGCARTSITDEEFQKRARDSIAEHLGSISASNLDNFIRRCAYHMDFRYQEIFGIELPDAYERLLLDCMLGDQTLFWRSDGIEASWSLVTPVLKRWGEKGCPLAFYKSGSWGPRESEALLERDGRQWRRL